MNSLNQLRRLILLAIALFLAGEASAQIPGFEGGPGGSGGRPGGGAGGGRRGGSGNSAAMDAQNKVVAVADERSNSIILLAPEDQLPLIEELINELDADVDDVTEVRLIKLANADPLEVAEQINQLFGDNQNQDQQRQRFGVSAILAGTRVNNTGERGKRSAQEVIAIPDPRTSSLIISAPRQSIDMIEKLVKRLDTDRSRREKVFVYSFEYADVNKVAEILRGMFEGENTRTTQTGNQTDAISNRANTFGNAGAANAGAGGARGGGAGGIGGR